MMTNSKTEPYILKVRYIKGVVPQDNYDSSQIDRGFKYLSILLTTRRICSPINTECWQEAAGEYYPGSSDVMGSPGGKGGTTETLFNIMTLFHIKICSHRPTLICTSF